MEVVSTTNEDRLNSERSAVEIGVDRLLGGTDAESMLEILAGSEIAYCPFPGRPQGHPTRLDGTPEQIIEDCRRFEALGCAGVDLLTHRATEADPIELVRAERQSLAGKLIVGSVNTPPRVRELAEAGVEAFTVSSAAFNGSFSPRRESMRFQIFDILAACA